MIVKVAIDLALDRLFDYEVPVALQEKLAVGQLLSVPFGHREARGFAMEIVNSLALSPLSPLASLSSVEVVRQEGQEGQEAKGQKGLKRRERLPSFTLKPIVAIVDETPFFSPALLELVKKVAAYTASPLESVLKTALPAAVLKKNAHPRELLYVEPQSPSAPSKGLTKRQQWIYEQLVRLGGGWMTSLCRELDTTPGTLRVLATLGWAQISPKARRRNPLGMKRILPSKPLPLNDEQQAALRAIGLGESAKSKPILLFGVTGSGKTEVYLQAIAAELAAGRGAIVMVPEISLTPQTVQRFASRFGDRVAVLHSALSDGERYDEWHRIRSGAARVVVGPRSAVWAPVRELGLIVVDEEHESSYKQDEMPRYHARDVAVLRGAIEGAKVVLGSATPSLESWNNAQIGKYALATMRSRAGAGTLPNVRLVDMARDEGPMPIFSQDLLEAIRLRLDRHEQSILFLNRRGFSRQLVCDGCGWVASCGKCSTDERALPYTYHQADRCLRCHVCGSWEPVPAKCPHCGSASLSFRGIGTQRVEAALAKCFPSARVLRMDADSTSRKHSHDDLLGAFGRHEADILVGTQMIAKGLDFPNVTLVGILNADSALNMPDFRAGERSYQLFSQVAGRAGRAELPGVVYLQTSNVRSAILGNVLSGDFEKFAAEELRARKAAFLPPYSHLAVVNLRSQEAALVGRWATMYGESLIKFGEAVRKQVPAGKPVFEVSAAIPSVIEKADGWYRWQIVLRAVSATLVAKAWRWLRAERPAPKGLVVGIDIDAMVLI